MRLQLVPAIRILSIVLIVAMPLSGQAADPFDRGPSVTGKAPPAAACTSRALGKVSAMIAGSDPQFVYALDQDNQALHVIDTIGQTITNTIAYPYPEPIAMAYSAPDNDLFMVSRWSGQIAVYDIDTSLFSEITFSTTEVGGDIEVSPSLRRIYVFAPGGSFDSIGHILDMDTGQLLHTQDMIGTFFTLDELRNKIYSGIGGSPPSLCRYLLKTDDTFKLEQHVGTEGMGGEPVISHNGLHLLYRGPAGGGIDDAFHDFDPKELEDVMGRWRLDARPSKARFSLDDKLVYATSFDDDHHYLHVMYRKHYWEIRRLDFPNSGYYNRFTTNSDNSVIVGFSYDDKHNDEYMFYFFEDIQLPVNPPPPPLGKVSDMTSGNDPVYVYGLDESYKKLLIINTVTRQVESTVNLPYTEPRTIAYSHPDHKLYITFRWSGQVVVYDLATSTFSEIEISPKRDCYDMVIAPQRRRLYVSVEKWPKEWVHIVDMDTHQILLMEEVNGISLAVDEVRERLFISGYKTESYLVSNDQLVYEAGLSGHSTYWRLNLSPDGEHLTRNTNDSIRDHDALILGNDLGEWPTGHMSRDIIFSWDMNALFGAGYGYLSVNNCPDYWFYKKFPFPNSEHYCIITPNSDDTMVVGFSYNEEDNTDHALYFFDDVRPPASPPPHPLGKISDMACGADSEFIYALDQDYRLLYMVSTRTDMIMPEIWLPEVQPLAMSYSDVDNSLYIVSRFSGRVTVYDLDTGLFSDLMFSPYEDGLDIEVAPEMRRVYVLSPDGNSSYADLFALDMDTGKMIFPGISVYGTILALDEQREKLFVGEMGSGQVARYSVKNDLLDIEQLLHANDSSMRNLEISHDGLHVLFHCDKEGFDCVLYDYDATDFDHMYGKWYFDHGIQRAVYGPDDGYLYVVTYDELNPRLLVMNGKNYQFLKDYPFPNSNEYGIFAPRNKRTPFAGFSRNDDGGEECFFLFPGD